MELNTFAIVVSTLLSLQVIAILLRIQIVYTVKAGSKDSYHLCFGLNAKKQDYITVNGEKKNISSLTRLLVRGNSMKDFNISNRQTVFVERLSKSASSSICDHPVLVFTLKEEKYPLDSMYKLRKFIAYQNLKNVDWHIVYNTYRERIYIDEEAFVSENDWHIHFNSLNVLYWSIVDILDSIDGFVSQIPANIYMFKALFYRVMKSNLSSFFDLVLKYRYPNIDSQDITAFMKDLIVMCKLYNDSFGDTELGLIEWLEMGSRQKELVFVQDEEELVMLTELSLLYRSEISTWINSRLIMDNEIDIIYDFKKNPVSVDGKILNNYIFVDSKTDTMVQLSDVAVGIVSKYLYFIDQHGTESEKIIYESFNENQSRVFRNTKYSTKEIERLQSVVF